MSDLIRLRKLILAVSLSALALCMTLTNQAQTASTGAIIGVVTDQTGSSLTRRRDIYYERSNWG